MPIKKTKIVFDFDADSLKEMRKVLFQRGLTPQQFLKYIVELFSLRDERLDVLINEALAHKDINFGRNRANTSDAEAIYKMIEQGLQKKQNGA